MKKESFNTGWTVKSGVEDPFGALFGSGLPGTTVTLPHDAMIYEQRDSNVPAGSQCGYYPVKSYTYQKAFVAPNEWNGQKTLLEFEGVQCRAMVYLNGEVVANHNNGYVGFFADLTPFLRYGQENIVKVLALNEERSSRWYPGSGIYRDVWLWQSGEVSFTPEKQRITTVSIEENYAVLRLGGQVDNASKQGKKLRLDAIIRTGTGQTVTRTEHQLAVNAGSSTKWHTTVTVDTPQCWSIENPQLYRCVLKLFEGEILIDETEETFGIRTLSLDARKGLRINGQAVKLKGACIHHDNGIIGAASFYDAEKFRIRKLKEAGFNAIRSAHNLAGKALLRACDELGMLVMDEFSDMWNQPKNSSDGAMNFAANWQQNVEGMIDKDYNHPSVILYSTGNEIPEIGRLSGGVQNHKIAEEIRRLDPTRYSTIGISGFLAVTDDMHLFAAAMPQPQEQQESAGGSEEMNRIAGGTQQEMMDAFSVSDILTNRIEVAASAVDVVGYNYLTTRHVFEHQLHPDRVVVGSETYPPEIARLWKIVRKNPHVIGDFTWTGFDYIGEAGIGVYHYESNKQAQGWYPDRLAYCGDIDLNGTRRPISYLRQIAFGQRTAPFIAVERVDKYGKPYDSNNWKYPDCIDSWTFPGYENKPARVRVLAGCEEVELFLNGASLGRRAVGEKEALTAIFEITYQPGELTAVGYDRAVEVGRMTLKTAARATKVLACADRDVLFADGQSLAFVTVDLVDDAETWNRWQEKTITVRVEGAGILQGFGSAAPSAEGSYQALSWNTWDGRVMAVIRSTLETGDIRITFSTPGFADAVVKLKSVSP